MNSIVEYLLAPDSGPMIITLLVAVTMVILLLSRRQSKASYSDQAGEETVVASKKAAAVSEPPAPVPKAAVISPTTSPRKKGFIWWVVIIALLATLVYIFFFHDSQSKDIVRLYGDGEYEYDTTGFTGQIDTTIVFFASQPHWSAVDLEIPAGAEVLISATGHCYWDAGACPSGSGPEGVWSASNVPLSKQFLLPDKPVACLMGKYGESIFYIGKLAVIRTEKAGRLSLALNERWDNGWNWQDNYGQFFVRIVVKKG